MPRIVDQSISPPQKLWKTKNAANCPKLFGGQFAAFLCMIVYMRIIPALSGA
jgi:hypothetical protein